MNWQEFLLDPLQYSFMERAFLAALLVGAISGVVGSFVVVRGMSFLGDAMAHAILPGIAIAYLYDQDLFLGGLVAGVLTAFLIAWLARHEGLKEDSVIGVVFTGMFALGIAIISTGNRYTVDLAHILFGNILGVSVADLELMAACGLLVLGLILLFYKELLLTSFDPHLAQAMKLPTEGLRLLLLLMIAITIVASLRIVGAALMLSMLVTPAATAQMLAKRLPLMMLLAALIGMGSGLSGIYISYHYQVATGAAIVLTATTAFLLTFGLTRLRQT
jgi:ABC-type Mn2+/Zn2+ transport system permease subunit